jgi:DNA-binding SARP family transcriptional activator
VVQVHLLGRVGVGTDGGEPVDVGPPKCQAVLAVLALSVGEAVPVSRLVDLVWGEDPPRTADKTLQGYVVRLRKGLGPEAIARTGGAYRLDLDPDAVDVARFRRHLGVGDVDAALATWTGTPLAGLDVPGLTAAVDGLVEQWLGAVEDDLCRRVATDPEATIAPLTELTAAHPFQEGLWALLMT